jgi:16S rRNA (guanine966-N2)-methyltransferase
MRVITGTYKGHIFSAPRGKRTHPMGDKVRGALFNMLGDISGLTVLDAYSGSGALAIEAASRGAKTVYSIEIDNTAYRTITENIEKLGIQNIKASRANVSTWVSNNDQLEFDVIFADPPYTEVRRDILKKLTLTLRKNGVIVYSLPEAEVFELPSKNFDLLAKKRYANATLVFYRKVK